MGKNNYIIKSPERKTEPFKISVNQAGYFPKSAKKAAMVFPCSDFVITDEAGNIRYSGKTARFGYDKNSGGDVYIADFSEFKEKGCYRVSSEGELSAEFRIGTDVYDKLFHDISKAFYYFRCGCGLDEKYAGEYHHGKCHNTPALLWEDMQTELDVSGGWHDAGDYGRYVTPGACAAAQLLYAYRLFPEAFEKLRLNIPESGMPDILSECKYELMWLMKMQRGDGGVYHKATTKNHAPFVMPENDTEQVYVFPVSSSAAADLAAVCALAAGIYEKYDRQFSEELRAAAEKSTNWLEANENFIGFENPEGCNTGPYAESGDDSNRFWAYAEMYSLTGSEKYHSKAKELLKKDFPLTSFGYSETGGFGALAYLKCSFDTDVEIKKRLAGSFTAEAERLKSIADECGYGCAMAEYDFYWGSNMNVMQRGMIFAVTDCLEETGKYRPYAEAQLHYLLGMNALGRSYVTGNGEFRCNNPHLRPALADGIEECIPGMVSGGPNRAPGDMTAKELVPEGTPAMKCYADNAACYSLNEVTIYWNSPAVFVLGYLMG